MKNLPTEPYQLAKHVAELMEMHKSSLNLSARRRRGVGNRLMEIGDHLTRKHVVGCFSLNQLLGNHGRPTLRADLDPELGILADIYDFVANLRGLSVKAYRG